MATRNQILQAIADAEAIDAQPRYLNQSTKLMDPSQMVNQLGTPYNREGWTWPAQEDDEALYPITPDKTGFRFPNFTGIMSAARTQHPTERARTRGGYTDPGRGSYGPWMATGGRVGYVNGEFVDEDVNIAGPGFDVNENIEMASAPDPMDALNDMSMNIFGKPLHDLTPEEYDILIDMANDQAAPEQAQGLASLV